MKNLYIKSFVFKRMLQWIFKVETRNINFNFTLNHKFHVRTINYSASFIFKSNPNVLIDQCSQETTVHIQHCFSSKLTSLVLQSVTLKNIMYFTCISNTLFYLNFAWEFISDTLFSHTYTLHPYSYIYDGSKKYFF